MSTTKYDYDTNDNKRPGWVQELIGTRIVSSDLEKGTMVLDNGTVLSIATSNSSCCTWIELTDLIESSGLITNAKLDDDDKGDGEYKAWVHIITEAGINIAIEAEGNAGNGYYLHGFALDVIVTKPE